MSFCSRLAAPRTPVILSANQETSKSPTAWQQDLLMHRTLGCPQALGSWMPQSPRSWDGGEGPALPPHPLRMLSQGAGGESTVSAETLEEPTSRV